MRFAITSLSAIAVFFLFILISISIGTMSVIVLSAALCAAVILGGWLFLLGLVAWVIERYVRRWEIAHGR